MDQNTFTSNSEVLRNIIRDSDASTEAKAEALRKLDSAGKSKLNLLITGATGVGKSSTINAMFGTENAKVGTGPDPTTMEFTKYELGNLIIWDSPGLGDGAVQDKMHAEGISKLLNEKDINGNLLIDLVLVIIDGSSRDLGTSYSLIKNVVAPNLGNEKEKRILIGLNKMDKIGSLGEWNNEGNEPTERLLQRVKAMEVSLSNRVSVDTGLNIKVVSYCAGAKYGEDDKQEPSYNIEQLIISILSRIPQEKRTTVTDHVRSNILTHIHQEKHSVEEDHANTNLATNIGDGICDAAGDMIDFVGDLPLPLAIPGMVVGTVVGGAATLIGGLLSGIGSLFDD